MGNDSISRQAAIDALEKKKDKKSQGDISGFYNKIIQNDIDTLMLLPSADRLQGEWIKHERAEEVEGLLISNYECSECHSWERNASNYCPNCGADMRGDRL